MLSNYDKKGVNNGKLLKKFGALQENKRNAIVEKKYNMHLSKHRKNLVKLYDVENF